MVAGVALWPSNTAILVGCRKGFVAEVVSYPDIENVIHGLLASQITTERVSRSEMTSENLDLGTGNISWQY